MAPTYPKRLIEVDLPIKRISAHARREKSIRHGHISTLHIWWARRPLAACRAVICAALWPDPADENCPPAFRKAAARIVLDFARKVVSDTKLANDHCSPENFKLWQRLTASPARTSQPSTLNSQPAELRSALLNFIADFANWDNSTVREYLDTARLLTAVVSLMWANNETGVLFPVREIAEICRGRGVLFHCDAVQAAGKVEIDVPRDRGMQADYLSITGHKIGALKGIGALYVRRKAPFSPLIVGGHQEGNRRGGTECVPLIVGLGKAAELAKKHLPGYEKRVRPLRDALEDGILGSIPNTELNGHKVNRLANTTNITFHGIESEALLILLDQEGICALSGSACLADSDEPSHVVKAMKPESAASRQMLRFSMDAGNTGTEVEKVLSGVQRVDKMLRS